MVYLQDGLSQDDFVNALRKIVANRDYEIYIHSPGGDCIAAMEFVREIRKLDLEDKLFIRGIGNIGSSAAYIFTQLRCSKSMEPNGSLVIHGGHINANACEFFEGPGHIQTEMFYRLNKDFITTYFPNHLEEFTNGGGQVTISAKECFERRIVNYLKKGRLK